MQNVQSGSWVVNHMCLKKLCIDSSLQVRPISLYVLSYKLIRTTLRVGKPNDWSSAASIFINVLISCVLSFCQYRNRKSGSILHTVPLSMTHTGRFPTSVNLLTPKSIVSCQNVRLLAWKSGTDSFAWREFLSGLDLLCQL